MRPRTIIFLIFIIGIGLFFYSLTMPNYTDQKAVDDLLSDSYNIDKQEYYKQESGVTTSRNTFMDLGAGILLVSGALFVFLLRTKIKEFSDFRRLKTLNKLMVFISTNIACLLLIPGIFWYYAFRGMRGDYPPFADSIGIPIFIEISFVLSFLIPLNVFLFLTTIRSNLPANILIKADTWNKCVILWELLFGLLLLVSVLSLILFVIDGNHISILVNLFFIFILLTLRAGQISKYKQENTGITQTRY